MAKAGIKTVETDADVAAFIAAVPDARRRDEAGVLDELHRRVTGFAPKLWGPSIIGYGSYRYRYDSGREGVMCRAGFSPRKAAATVYLMGEYCDHKGEADALFARLGKHKTGKSCLYVSRLDQVDLAALEELVALSWRIMDERYPD